MEENVSKKDKDKKLYAKVTLADKEVKEEKPEVKTFSDAEKLKGQTVVEVITKEDGLVVVFDEATLTINKKSK